MMYLLQSPALIIECVVPARDNMYVRGHLQALVDQLGYHVVECSLRLENIWSAADIAGGSLPHTHASDL